MKRVGSLFGNRKTRRAPVRGGVRRRLGFDPLEPKLAPASLSIGDATIVEGNSGRSFVALTVTLSNPSPSKSATVSFATADGTATTGGDYIAQSGSLTLSKNRLTGQILVEVTGDMLDEADETIRVLLSNPQNASITDGEGLATIGDDDPAPSLAVDDTPLLEGNAGTSNAVFTVSLSSASGQTVSVGYSTAGASAVPGADFTAVSGTVTFAPGQTSQSVAVPVLGDGLDEDDETFAVALSNASGATIARAQGLGTILDDDLPATLRITGVTVTEGDSGTSNVVFTVSLLNTGGSGFKVSVNYTTADTVGTPNKATPNADYAFTSGTLIFAPGETSKTISVSVTGDTLNEFTEFFNVVLSNPTNATISGSNGVAQGTINDNDPVPSLSINEVTATEGDSSTVGAAFTVTLSAPSGKTVSISVSGGAAGDTATSGADYTVDPVTLTFLPGETTRTINAAVRGDLTDEDDERFSITLANPTNATLSRPRGTGTILDNALLPSIRINSASAPEGDGGTCLLNVSVVLSNASSKAVTVAYSTADGTAQAGADYQPASGTLTFAPGVTQVSIPVDVLGDTPYEADETFLITLSAPTNATIVVAQATGTILNNDPASTASFVGTDALTHGTWKGIYGTDGYGLAGDDISTPAYVSSLTRAGTSTHVLAASTADNRAPQRSAVGSTGRVAAGWWTWASMSFDIRMADPASRTISIYALDYDNGNRSEQLSLIDDRTGQVLDTRTISNFQNGVYLTWNVMGNVTIRVTNLNPGSNAVLSGLFFGKQ